MKKNFIFKFLISFILILFFTNIVRAKEPVFVSLSPALTEIMYELNAQNMLKGVSTACNYPVEVKNKEKIGDTFFINEEKILTIKPDYILAMDSSGFALNKFKKFNIKILCFQNQTVKAILNNIIEIGRLTNRNNEAIFLVNNINKKIAPANYNHKHRILYLVQTNPMISIGKKSFITDVIRLSGNTSVTAQIDGFYPAISEEYLIRQNPDVIVLSYFANDRKIKKLFPNSKIVYMNKDDNDIINRPGPRIYKSVEFFGKL